MTRARPEDAIQKAVVQWLQIQENLGRLTYFAIPNNPRNAIDGARLKQMGLRAGTPDLCIMTKGFAPIFIELKAPKGRLSDAQRLAADRLVEHGGVIVVCRSLDEVQGTIAAWIGREAA
jgi:hypothetical protein